MTRLREGVTLERQWNSNHHEATVTPLHAPKKFEDSLSWGRKPQNQITTISLDVLILDPPLVLKRSHNLDVTYPDLIPPLVDTGAMVSYLASDFAPKIINDGGYNWERLRI